MRLHRFIGNFNLDLPTIKIAEPEMINQILKVFRLKIGDELVLADGNKNEAICRLENIDLPSKQAGKKYIEVFADKKYKNKNEAKTRVVLYCSVLKKENFEWVVQKATEVGVSEIVPIISERTVKLNLNPKRLQKIIREAAEQSGRGLVPVIRSPIILAEALKTARENCKLFFDASGKDIFHVSCHLSHVAIFVGPEGGWTEQEKTAAQHGGCQIVSLSTLTLRAETAAVVASYLAINQNIP